MNVLILSGRLTKDFELKKEIARSSIAVDTFKGGTMFVDISVFGKSADYCIKYLRKGDFVAVEGELNIYKNDTKMYVSCSVHSIQSIGNKKSKDNGEVEITEEEPQATLDEPVADIDVDDTLPF